MTSSAMRRPGPSALRAPVGLHNGRRLASLMVAVAVMAAVFAPRPGEAAVSQLDAVMPDVHLVPTAGLMAWWPGGARAFGVPNTQWSVENGGKIAKFVDGNRNAAEFAVSNASDAPRIIAKLPKSLLSIDVTGDPLGGSGASISFWYSSANASKQVGWNPLVAVGDDFGVANNWKWAVMLKSGVPVFARRGDTELIVPKGIPTTANTGKGGVGRIDDGLWHHIALRLTRPGCGTSGCGVIDAVIVSLWVDGVLRGEAQTNVAADTAKVFLGWIPISGSGYPSQANYNAAQKRLMTYGRFQDVLVYRAALSVSELMAARSVRDDGLVSQFPPADGKMLGWTGNAPQVGVGLPASLLNSTAATQNNPINLNELASTKLAGVAGGSTNVDGNASVQATALWMRLPGGNKPGDLLSFAEPVTGVKRYTISMTANQQLKLVCHSTNYFSQGNPGPGPIIQWAPDSWHLLVVKNSPSTGVQLFMDGAEVITMATATCPAVNAPEVTLSRPADTPVAWGATWVPKKSGSGVLPTSHAISELASPGPAVWLRGPNLANLIPSSPATPAGISANFSAKAGTVAPRSLEIDVSKHALGGSRRHGSTEGSPPFTASLAFRITALPPNGANTSILRRTLPQAGGYETDLQLWCGSNACTLCIHSPPAATGGGALAWCIDQAFEKAKDYRVTVTSPVMRKLQSPPDAPGQASGTALEPMIFVNGVQLNRYFTNDPQKLIIQGNSGASSNTSNNGGKWALGILSGMTNDFSITVSELRLYAYAIRNTKDVGASCSTLDCAAAGQACQEASGALSAVCQGCAASSVAMGGTHSTTAECSLKAGFYEPCIVGPMCASGLCGPGGICIATNKAECDTGCGKLGRTCVGSGANFTCGGCLPGFEAAPGSDPMKSSCGWSPKKKGWETCNVNSECMSGACRDVTFNIGPIISGPTYPTLNLSESDNDGCKGTCPYTMLGNGKTQQTPANRTVRRCLMDLNSGESCDKEPLYAATTSVESVVRPDGTTSNAAWCADGSTGACAPHFERKTTVLSPAACNAVLNLQPDQKTGGCSFQYCWSCAGCRNRSDLAVSEKPRHTALWKTNAGTFSLQDLKLIFLNDTSPYKQNPDEFKLRTAGVGELLLAYAAATLPQKQAMSAKYGNFLPVGGCGGQSGAGAYLLNQAPYANQWSCMPQMQEDGAKCPPAGQENNTSIDKNRWCRSVYCGRDDGTCKRGDNPLSEVAGNAGNQNRSGKSAVKFGVVRVDDTQVQLEDGTPAANQQNEKVKEIRYTADVNQAHVACILGVPFPPVPVFETRIHLDRSQGQDCASSEFRSFVLGFPLTSPKPGALAGSCTGYEVSANASGFKTCGGIPGASAPPGCQPVDPNNLSLSSLAMMAIPTVHFCLPLDDMGIELPEKKKDFKEAIVPLVVSIGLTLDACIDFSVGMDDQGLPQAEIKPGVALGVDARGGVGTVDGESGMSLYEFSAGVRLTLTLVGISFPITWAVDVSDVFSPAGQHILGMFKLAVIQKISMVLDILSGDFGLYAEFSIGPFGLEWTLPIFEWTGFIFNFDISEVPLWSTTLDFRAQFMNALAGPAKATCDGGPSSPCYK